MITRILNESTNLKNLTIINNIEEPTTIFKYETFNSLKKLKSLKLEKPSIELHSLTDAIIAGSKESLEALIIDSARMGYDGRIV